jgi:hypothetical protein
VRTIRRTHENNPRRTLCAQTSVTFLVQTDAVVCYAGRKRRAFITFKYQEESRYSEADHMKTGLRLLTQALLSLAPVFSAISLLTTTRIVEAQCYFNCSTNTTIIPGFPVESIAGGLLLGLLLLILGRLITKGALQISPNIRNAWIRFRSC